MNTFLLKSFKRGSVLCFIMKAIAICLEGIEDVVAKDVKGKKICKGRVRFDYKKGIESRGAQATYTLLKKFSFKNKKDILNKIESINFEIPETFKVECKRKGKHTFNSFELEKDIGVVLFRKGFKVDIKNPETIVFIDIIDNTGFVGYLVNKYLCKRDYRIKIHNQSINACLAYALIKLSNWDKGLLVDPFCKDGVICIEAALSNSGKVYGFDESKNNIRNAKINGEYAEAKVIWGNYDLSWLSTKFEKIDCIISNVPFESKRRSEKEVREKLRELFKQVKGLLKKKMVLISRKDEIIEEESKDFRLIEKRELVKGQEKWFIFVFEP